MTVFQKIKWFVAVLGVFLIILMTNLLDKQNFLRVEEVVENIYNDRLLAKELLLDVSTKFHQKELAYVINDTVYLEKKNDKINSEITELLTMFDRTNQTRDERKILVSLRENHDELMRLESNSQLNESLYTKVYSDVFSSIAYDIKELSAEQVEEGKLQTMHAKDAVDIANLFSKIEIYILIFLGLVIQFIILYTPKDKSKEK
jgi:hypothetical protein